MFLILFSSFLVFSKIDANDPNLARTGELQAMHLNDGSCGDCSKYLTDSTNERLLSQSACDEPGMCLNDKPDETEAQEGTE